ncbi:hypothetical protein GCM10027275_21000 [Rhabdobacter roseus]
MINLVLYTCVVFANCVRPQVKQPNGQPLDDNYQVRSTPALVERGRYLTQHVAACVDCHSQRDWSRLAGPIIPGSWGGGGQEYGKNYGLPGRVYGRNITPYALKGWSDKELLVAITAGVGKTGKPLFPLMPYANYHRIRQSDAEAIIVYLRTLPPVAQEVPPSRVPLPLRLGLRLLPHRATLAPDSGATSGLAYGRYLTQLAGCADCHTNRTAGKLLKKAPFAGGMSISLAAMTKEGGTLRSANITPDSSAGLGSWSRQAFVARFKAYDSAVFVPPAAPEGFNTVMPWTLYAGMTESDLGAIYEYLRTVKPVKKPVVVYSPNRKNQPGKGAE